jgi:serine phosphatase RsbU (regulator of sigma subunit)
MRAALKRGVVTVRHDDEEVAAALQRVLLPPALPEIESWALATLYEPAGEAVMVGGDFYDWFRLPDGRVVFFIGDVSGKGPLAGALAMSIRKALKGISWITLDPLAALPTLQLALADEFGELFATLCLLELRPGSGSVRVILAGHPAPLLRRGGAFAEGICCFCSATD